MYYISAIWYYDDEKINDFISFLNDMVSQKVLKSFYFVEHGTQIRSSCHFHFYFEFYSKKQLEDNFGLFSSFGIIGFRKVNLYKWISYVGLGFYYFDNNLKFDLSVQAMYDYDLVVRERLLHR